MDGNKSSIKTSSIFSSLFLVCDKRITTNSTILFNNNRKHLTMWKNFLFNCKSFLIISSLYDNFKAIKYKHDFYFSLSFFILENISYPIQWNRILLFVCLSQFRRFIPRKKSKTILYKAFSKQFFFPGEAKCIFVVYSVLWLLVWILKGRFILV
jgi:hypothetical protein